MSIESNGCVGQRCVVSLLLAALFALFGGQACAVGAKQPSAPQPPPRQDERTEAPDAETPEPVAPPPAYGHKVVRRKPRVAPTPAAGE